MEKLNSLSDLSKVKDQFNNNEKIKPIKLKTIRYFFDEFSKKINKVCYLLIGFCLLFFCGCVPQKQKNLTQEEVDKITPLYDLRRPDFKIYAWEDTINGHIYVFTCNSGIHSVTYVIHSPNCKCFKK